ncbi:MAG: hypothetical protein M1827_003003 [Pycnora praestabilis]|nr:MAG: hypothetical protein M1827_003003 [Pycnora praestabilis]
MLCWDRQIVIAFITVKTFEDEWTVADHKPPIGSTGENEPSPHLKDREGYALLIVPSYGHDEDDPKSFDDQGDVGGAGVDGMLEAYKDVEQGAGDDSRSYGERFEGWLAAGGCEHDGYDTWIMGMFANAMSRSPALWAFNKA